MTETILIESLNSESASKGILKIYKVFKESFELLESQIAARVSNTSTIKITLSDTFALDVAQTLKVESALKKWNESEWIAPSSKSSSENIPSSIATSISRESDSIKISVTDLIYEIKRYLPVDYIDRLITRLLFLRDASLEEYPQQQPISYSSIYDFIKYLYNSPKLSYPNVVLTPSGNIRAQWRKASNRHFAVEFLGDGNARFVVFAPDPKVPSKTTRVSGLTSIDSLMEIVSPYKVVNWASSAESSS